MSDRRATATLLRHLRPLADASGLGEFSDRQLLERFVGRRDEEAFAALVRRHAALVYGAGWRLLRQAQDAEDVFQATFLVLARKAGSMPWRCSVANWLYGVARRLALKVRADARRRRQRDQATCDRAATETAAELARRELLASLDEEVHGLPERYRLPVVLCHLEGRTRDQAARELGWSLRTLQRRLEQGKQLLRHRLTRHGLALPSALLVASLSRQAAEAGLFRSTVRAATTATARSAEVAALVEAGMSSATVGGARLVAILGLGFCLLTGGLGLLTGQAPVATAPPGQDRPAGPPPIQQVRPARLDAHGDPVPPGAQLRLGGLRFRHPGRIAIVAYSTDGKWLASAGDDKVVCVWDATTGQLRHRFHTPNNYYARLAFSPTGTSLAMAFFDHKILVWDLATKKQQFQAEGATFVFSADGQRLFTGGRYARLGGGAPSSRLTGINREPVRCWDAVSGKEQIASGKFGRGWPAAVSPDGKRLLLISADRPDGQADSPPPETLHVWDVEAGKELRNQPIEPGEYVAATFTDGGATAVSRRYDRAQSTPLLLWDADAPEMIRELKVDSRWTTIVAFAPDGKTLATSDLSGGPRLWDVATGKLLHRFGGDVQGTLFTGAFSPDGQTLATGGEGRAVRFWNVADGTERHVVAGHAGGVEFVAMTPDGRTVLSAGRDSTVRFWDGASGRQLNLWRKPGVPLSNMTASADGKLLAGVGHWRVYVWELQSDRERLLANLDSLPDRLALSPDGRRLAAVTTHTDKGKTEPGVRVWDVAARKELWKQPSGHPTYRQTASFSPDGRLLATAGHDGVVRLRDAATGAEVRALLSHPGMPQEGPATDFVFSPDGRMVAAVRDRGLRLWEVATGGRRLVRENLAPFWGVAWSPDGRWLAVGGEDGRVRLCDAATGLERRCLEGHRAAILTLSFSADGRTLVSGSMDTTVLVWDLTDLVARVKRVPVELTAAEMAGLWDDLAGADAARAYRAMVKLRDGGDSVSFLTTRVRPASPPDAQRLADLLEQLKSDRFEARQKATAEIDKISDQAEPALRKLLKTHPALEVRQRVEHLLARLATPASDELRALRAVEVMEQIGDAPARRSLEALSNGAPQARLTREAQQSLKRLNKSLPTR
jgi:RNA polymerase sigma factor (sigma-70 family)